MLLLDPFKITTATDDASADILNRVNSQYYNSKAQREIVVVLIDDQYLSSNQLSWPLSYSQQSVLLRQILRYEPKALFIDLLYTHDRSTKDDAPQPLINVFERYGERIPIYVPEIKESAFSKQNFFKKTRPVVVQWQGHEHYYPSRVESIDTPAFAMHRQFCEQHGNCNQPNNMPPIAIQWGMQLSKQQDLLTNNKECLGEENPIIMASKVLLSEVFWKLVPEWRQPCAYSITVPPSYLSATSEDERALLSSILKDKFVMLGALIQGARDEVYSPVHGQIAGVYLHAMALDNLLTYHDEYFRPAPTIWRNIDLADITDCLLFLLVFMWREKVSTNPKDPLSHAPRKRFIFYSALTLLALLFTTVVLFSYVFNFQPINWVAQLTLILSIVAIKIRLFAPLKKLLFYLKGLYQGEKL